MVEGEITVAYNYVLTTINLPKLHTVGEGVSYPIKTSVYQQFQPGISIRNGRPHRGYMQTSDRRIANCGIVDACDIIMVSNLTPTTDCL